MKPRFYIISGPNGAAKSTYCEIYVPVGTHVFNGDLVYAGLLERYPNYDPQKLKGGVAVQLERERDEAILKGADFAFESNYSTEMAIEITRHFIKAGYETNLIYFGLDSVETAALRVDTRVLQGGHHVSNAEILFNMEEGIKRVRSNLKLYDTIQFVDTAQLDRARVIAFYHRDAGQHTTLYENIKWFNEHFRNSIIELSIDRKKALSHERRLQWENKQETEVKRNRGMKGPKR